MINGRGHTIIRHFGMGFHTIGCWTAGSLHGLLLLGHANYRPVAGSSLHYTHACSAEDISVHPSVNGLVPISEEQEAYLAQMQEDPSIHNELTPELMGNLNPEVLFFLHKYQADGEGWAHSMQKHEGGETADYIKHRPEQLDKCVRW